MDKIIAGLILALGLALFMVLASAYGGFVFMVLWNWYAVPFTSIQLTLPQAIGVTFLLPFIRGWKRNKDGKDEAMEAFAYSMTFITITLFSGWVLHFFL